VLRLFLGAAFIYREVHTVELYARLSYRDQCGISNFIGTKGSQASDGSDQGLHFARALAGKASEWRQMKTAGFIAFDKPVPRKIIECLLECSAIPATLITGLLGLKNAEARLKKVDDVISGNALGDFASSNKNPDDKRSRI
jgi:hypothetical protein